MLEYGVYAPVAGGDLLPPPWLSHKRYRKVENVSSIRSESRSVFTLYHVYHRLPTRPTSDKKRAGFISETRLLARHLLPLVLSLIAANPGLSLSDAATSAAAGEQHRMQTDYGLSNIKQICSGAPGGLGKPKKPRRYVTPAAALGEGSVVNDIGAAGDANDSCADDVGV